MMYAKGHGRVGRGHCGICYTPFGCALPGLCPCHRPVGGTCRAAGCVAGLFVAVPADSDTAILDARLRLLDEFGYEGAI
jgi:hypothetical protein